MGSGAKTHPNCKLITNLKNKKQCQKVQNNH